MTIGRRNMQFHLRMFLQKELHPLGLVSGEVIHDHINLPLLGLTTGQLIQEGQSLHRVFAGSLAEYLTGRVSSAGRVKVSRDGSIQNRDARRAGRDAIGPNRSSA